MDAGMLVLRVVHIGCGVFWAGTILFFVTMLEPSIRENGPDGAKVMQALIRRGYLNLMPVLGLLTVLSGVDLLRRVSNGFDPAWFREPIAHVLGTGMVLSIVALTLGVSIMRPIGLRIGPMTQAAMQLPAGPEREASLATLGVLRNRLVISGRIIATLLAISVLTMAVARYL